jgi:pantetheine-phosphate adenylyltransferase
LKILLYPGSFDPPTLGHLDVVKRGCLLCEQMVIGISCDGGGKKMLFTAEERKELFESYLVDLGLSVRIDIYDELTVSYAEKIGASAILRGLRTYSDFEYEFQMAAMNRYLSSKVDTIFIRTGEDVGHISSTFVKSVAQYTSVSGMVSPVVEENLRRKFNIT